MSYVSTYQAHLLEGLSSGQKSVISALATFERAGKAWPSVATLAKRASMGIRTVQRHLAALINLGYITRTYRQGHAAVTRLFIGQTTPPTPAKLAPPPLPNWHPEPGISESVNQIPIAVHEPATPEPGTETATADVVFTENEQPITHQAITQEIPDVLAIDSMVPVSEVTGCHPQAGMPVEAYTAPLEPSQEVLATDPLADVPATLLQDLGEIRRNKKRPAKVTKTEAALWWTEAQKCGWDMQQVVLTMILHGWARFQADWVQHLPPQTAPGTPAAPKVWQPEPHTPASASTIAKMKERITAMKARWKVESLNAPPPKRR